jgi:Flp pilus assembly protein TadB
MTGALVVGILAGLGLVALLSALVPARTPVGVVLDRLHRQPPAAPPRPLPEGAGSAARLAQRLTRSVEESGAAAALSRSIEKDLRVVGMTPGEYVVRRVAWAIGAGLVPPVMAALASAAGVMVPPSMATLGALAFAFLGWFVPAVTVRSGARARREDFTYALSAFVDLLTVALSGGLGVDEALERCAAIGQGWSFGEIRRALALAQLHKEAAWDGLARLGRELGVRELEELAASVTLAGKDGARVTASITAKAKAMREHAQSRVEASANTASELMSLPLMVMLLGFVLFVAFPTIATISGGLTP